LWTVSFRKLGTIRSDGQNTRLNLCLVVQRSVRESDSEHGAKDLSEWSVLKTNFIHPQMRSPVSAQNQGLGNRSSQVSLSLAFSHEWSLIYPASHTCLPHFHFKVNCVGTSITSASLAHIKVSSRNSNNSSNKSFLQFLLEQCRFFKQLITSRSTFRPHLNYLQGLSWFCEFPSLSFRLDC
jgi:hypothetical protein